MVSFIGRGESVTALVEGRLAADRLLGALRRLGLTIDASSSTHVQASTGAGRMGWGEIVTLDEDAIGWRVSVRGAQRGALFQPQRNARLLRKVCASLKEAR